MLFISFHHSSSFQPTRVEAARAFLSFADHKKYVHQNPSITGSSIITKKANPSLSSLNLLFRMSSSIKSSSSTKKMSWYLSVLCKQRILLCWKTDKLGKKYVISFFGLHVVTNNTCAHRIYIFCPNYLTSQFPVIFCP